MGEGVPGISHGQVLAYYQALLKSPGPLCAPGHKAGYYKLLDGGPAGDLPPLRMIPDGSELCALPSAGSSDSLGEFFAGQAADNDDDGVGADDDVEARPARSQLSQHQQTKRTHQLSQTKPAKGWCFVACVGGWLVSCLAGLLVGSVGLFVRLRWSVGC